MDLVYKENNTSRWLTNLAYSYVVLMTLFSTLWFPSNVYTPPLMWYQFYPVSMMIGFYISAVWNYKNSAYSFLLLLQLIFSLIGFGANLAYIIIVGLIIGKVGINQFYDGEYSYLNFVDSRHFQITSTTTKTSTDAWLIGQLTLGAMNFAVVCLASFIISLYETCRLETNFVLMCKNHCCGVRNQYDTARKFLQSLAVIFFIWGVVLSVLTFVYFGDLIMPIAAFQNQHCWFFMMICMSLFPPIQYQEHVKEEADGLLIEENETKAAKDGRGLDEKTTLWISGFVTSLIITVYTIAAEVSFRDLNSLPRDCGTSSDYQTRLNGSTEWVYFKVNSITPALQSVNYTWVGSSLPNSRDWTCFNYATNCLIVCFHLLFVFFLIPVSISYVEDPVLRTRIKEIKEENKNKENKETQSQYVKSRYGSMKAVYYEEDLHDKLYPIRGKPSRRLKS